MSCWKCDCYLLPTTRELPVASQRESRTRKELIHFIACQTTLPHWVTELFLLRFPAVCVHSAFRFQVFSSPVSAKPTPSHPQISNLGNCCEHFPLLWVSPYRLSQPSRWWYTRPFLFFFFLSDAKHDLQAWVIIYHYSFSVTSALKVNRNASMLTDLLSKIFVPRFRSDDWCLSELEVYALWKASWLDLEPLAPALYITLVEWPSEPQDTLDVFNTCFLLPYYWHCIHSSWTYVM